MAYCPCYLHRRGTFQYLFITITCIHIACNLSFSLTLHTFFITTQRNVPLSYVDVKVVINKNYILAYYMSDPIWETVCKLKSNCSSRVITFSPPHSLTHISKFCNMFLTICILLAGDIHMNPGPPILQNIRFATSNVRSVHDTSASITDLVISKKLDILALTETWLSPHDTPYCISYSCPTHYSFYHQPCKFPFCTDLF